MHIWIGNSWSQSQPNDFALDIIGNVNYMNTGIATIISWVVLPFYQSENNSCNSQINFKDLSTFSVIFTARPINLIRFDDIRNKTVWGQPCTANWVIYPYQSAHSDTLNIPFRFRDGRSRRPVPEAFRSRAQWISRLSYQYSIQLWWWLPTGPEQSHRGNAKYTSCLCYFSQR